MTNVWTTLAAMAVLIGWGVLIVMAFSLVERYRKRKLLKCPETGGVSLVDIEWDTPHPATPEATGKPVPTIKDCLLWPEKKGCSKGCLDNRAETRADNN
ncbi:MAG: hypothetical protein IH856_14535 [Deltaproteobacteria bacterium]|nr:hypothetical protein [Deltaproteobacteria bacterium]MCZ6562525.1 hypothetical protein [Deltaproteobacteria bacterium]